MFSRWMFAKLKAAERALDEGRLDEAYDRLAKPDVRENRRARPAVERLSKALLAQARLHAQAGRYRDALLDLDRLDGLERSNEEAQALRSRVEQEHRARVGRHAEEHDAFRKAADHVKAGKLDTGRLALERIEDPARREQLREEIDIRVERGEQLVEQATAALAQDDWLAACRFWDEAVSRHGRTRSTDELAGRVVPRYREGMDAWLREGRLDRLRNALVHSRRLREFSPQLSEYDKLADLVQRAGAQLAGSDYASMRQTLARLRASAGDATWLAQVASTLEKLLDAQSELLASPLGLLGQSVYERAAPPDHQGATQTRHKADSHAHPGASHKRGAPLGVDPLLMLIDGTGSALLIAADIVKIGRAGGMSGIDVPVPSDIQSHHADIEREGSDYFLVAHGPVRINQRAVTRGLLRDGDGIVLGETGRLVFRKPSAKSETAVLVLSSRNRLPLDVSHVVLMSDTCLLGPQQSCHITTREGDARLVLFDRGGELYVRRTGRDGRPTGPAIALPANETSDIVDQRLTVKKYEPRGAGRIA
jgi:pSer/pThr/pTyr-binding forkhead associated (FHA) protein